MVKCKICDESGRHPVHTTREMMFGYRDEFRYIECVSCGCLQIAPVPADLDRYYPDDYYSYAPRKTRSRGRIRAALKRHRAGYQLRNRGVVRRILSLIDPPREYFGWLRRAGVGLESRILDVGCGSGQFLLKLQSHGFTRIRGIDPFIPADIDYGGGLIIQKCELDRIEGEYDFILLNHSFEHLPHPRQALGQIHRVLRPGGYALLRIPLAASFAWKKYRTNWVQMDPPRHLFLHTTRSMEILSGQVGLEVAEVAFDSTEFQFLGSEQYLMDIPLRDPKSHFENRKHPLFTRRQIADFRCRAGELNRRGEGDQACFYLRHRTH